MRCKSQLSKSDLSSLSSLLWSSVGGPISPTRLIAGANGRQKRRPLCQGTEKGPAWGLFPRDGPFWIPGLWPALCYTERMRYSVHKISVLVNATFKPIWIFRKISPDGGCEGGGEQGRVESPAGKGKVAEQWCHAHARRGHVWQRAERDEPSPTGAVRIAMAISFEAPSSQALHAHASVDMAPGWIPAFAGMTAFREGIAFPAFTVLIVYPLLPLFGPIHYAVVAAHGRDKSCGCQCA